MQSIDTQQLRDMFDKHDDFILVNVLGEEQFEAAHIPGSINIPVGSDDFVDQVEEAAGDKERRIVVYCASTDCDASLKAAKKLDKAGFSNVLDFEGGTKAWKEADHDIETGAEATA